MAKRARLLVKLPLSKNNAINYSGEAAIFLVFFLLCQLLLYCNILSFWIYKHYESNQLNCGVLCLCFIHFNQCLCCKFVSSKWCRICFVIICCCVCSDSWSFLDAVIEVKESYFKSSVGAALYHVDCSFLVVGLSFLSEQNVETTIVRNVSF